MPNQRLYDNTALSCFRQCPRKYFYRHVEHLVPDSTAAPLAFGSSWGKAMDVVWDQVCTMGSSVSDGEVTKSAYLAWEEEWKERGFPGLLDLTPDDEDKLKARTPHTALSMIQEYLMRYRDWLVKDVELVAIEQPFAVPLTPDDPTLWYCGRMDKVLKERDGIYVYDHKTTTRYAKIGNFRKEFLESFSPDSQMDGYAYAAHMNWPDEFKGVYVDAALVHKNVNDGFTHIPVSRHVNQLGGWRYECRRDIERLEQELEDLREWKDLYPDWMNGEYTPAFPKNTGACYSYNTECPYADLCKGFSNPAGDLYGHGTPLGYKIEPWSPFDHIQLELLGFTRGD